MDIKISDLIKYKGKSCSVIDNHSDGLDLYNIDDESIFVESVKEEEVKIIENFKHFKKGDIVIPKEKITNIFINFSDKFLIIVGKHPDYNGVFTCYSKKDSSYILHDEHELIRVIPSEFTGDSNILIDKLVGLSIAVENETNLKESEMSNQLSSPFSPSNGQQRIKSILHEDMKQTRLVDRIREIQFNHQHDSVHDEYKQVLSAIDVFISKDSRTRFVYPKQLSMTIVKRLQKEGLTVTTDNKTTIISWS